MVSRVEIGRGADNVTWNVYIDATRFVTIDRTGIQSYLTGQDRFDNDIVSATGSDVLQMSFDERTPLADFPSDDPDKTTDPALPSWFHARIFDDDEIGQGQNRVAVWRPIALVGGTATHMVARSSLLTVRYTGSIDTATIDFGPPTVLR